MPRRLESAPNIQVLLSGIDEPLGIRNPNAIAETAHATIGEVIRGDTRGIALVYKPSHVATLKSDVHLIEKMKLTPELKPYVGFDWDILHRKGLAVGILFTPPPSTNLLADQKRRIYFKKDGFQALQHALMHLPEAMQIDAALLTDTTMLCAENPNLHNPGLQLLAVSKGAYTKAGEYEVALRKRFKTLLADFSTTS